MKVNNLIKCFCGCGTELLKFDNRWRPRGFIHGHWLKKTDALNIYEFKKNSIPWNKNKKGIHLSAKSEFKKGISPWNKGLEGYMAGDKNPMYGKSGILSPVWKGGFTSEDKLVRATDKYKKWRKKVFERDNFTCQWCGQVGGQLNADHIKPFAFYPDFRFNLDNGRTLCVTCHKKTPNYGAKGRRQYVGKTI